MKLEIETDTYNEKRYGKPWIAKVDFHQNRAGYKFGSWIGDPGGVGLLVLSDVEDGDIVAKGQKDNRNPKHTENEMFIVQQSGELVLVSKGEAYKHWQSKNEVLTK